MIEHQDGVLSFVVSAQGFKPENLIGKAIASGKDKVGEITEAKETSPGVFEVKAKITDEAFSKSLTAVDGLEKAAKAISETMDKAKASADRYREKMEQFFASLSGAQRREMRRSQNKMMKRKESTFEMMTRLAKK